ncbi:hypothetical protein [Paraburkholderia sp. BR13444]|uniref:hypothetical protein n=1 Tax=Paraburkholderia sp. BR13444 TaxID=3236997 RepID=UPI0034CF9FF3
MGTKLRDALRAAGLRGSGDRTKHDERSASPIALVQDDAFTNWQDKALSPSKVPLKGAVAPITKSTGDRRPENPLQADSRPGIEAKIQPVQKPPRRLVKSGPFSPHDAFLPDPMETVPLPSISLNGIAASLTADPENETDLIVGLDFGTSSTKVVVRDAYAATSIFPVQLCGQRSGIESFLLPSRIFKTGSVYSLQHGTEKISDLKLSLLNCSAASPVDEFNDCCAFLALVIRRTRAWFLTEHRDIYSRHALNWKLNLGLPARSYENTEIVQLFRRLAWAAANLAGDSEATDVTLEKASEWRIRSHEMAKLDSALQSPPTEFGCNDVDVVPEVSAQLQGFMTAARWDWRNRPIMMLVDVGAGTVDSALFHVRAPDNGHGQLTFYSSKVEQNGVMNLHRARVASLNEMLPCGEDHQEAREYLRLISQPTDRLRPIPETIDQYLPGYQEADAGIDTSFRIDRYRRQVASCIRDAKVGKGISAGQLVRVPLLLCGGGSRMRFYGSIDQLINNTPGWDLSVELMKLPVPSDLADSGWHGEEFDRLSVAYGLSLSGDGDRSLGKIVRAIEVPDAENYRPKDAGDCYVSKDQV